VPVLVLYGVTGAGKSLVGRLLATQLGWPFYDADDLHTPSNLDRLSDGIPLTDADRWPWLQRVRALIAGSIQRGTGAVVACSALKAEYREYLRIDDRVKLIHLTGDVGLIAERLRQREGHFMNPALLRSQADALEPAGPETALVLDVASDPDQIVRAIRTQLAL
jgi:gluconokinase